MLLLMHVVVSSSSSSSSSRGSRAPLASHPRLSNRVHHWSLGGEPHLQNDRSDSAIRKRVTLVYVAQSGRVPQHASVSLACLACTVYVLDWFNTCTHTANIHASPMAALPVTSVSFGVPFSDTFVGSCCRAATWAALLSVRPHCRAWGCPMLAAALRRSHHCRFARDHAAS